MKTKANSEEARRSTRILRHRVTGQYFDGQGWTSNPEQAQGFDDVLDAAQVCIAHDLQDVELATRHSACGP